MDFVTKAISKYFKQFIKGFKKDQFNVSVLKGTAQLVNLDLNESFIQELLLIPTTLEVISASCNDLKVKIPNVRKLSKKPVVLTLDNVNLSLEEPEVVKPMPNSDSEQKKGKKKKLPHQIVRDMKVVINQALIRIKLKPREQDSWVPEFTIELKNVVIQSTNDQFQVVGLSDTRVKTGHFEKSFKNITCDSISLSLISSEIIPVVKDLPLQVKVTLTLDLDTNEYVGASLDVVIDQIKFSCDEISWQMLVNLIMTLKKCLERDIPPQEPSVVVSPRSVKDKKKSSENLLPPTPTEVETSYSLSIGKWSLEFLKRDKKNEGFLFFGNDYQFFISPKSRVQGDLENPNLFESSLKIKLQSLTFTTLHQNRQSKYPNLIQQMEGENQCFIDIVVKHKWAALNEPRSSYLDAKLFGLQVVVDRTIWEDLYNFLIANIQFQTPTHKTPEIEEVAPEDAEKDVQKVIAIIEKFKTANISDYFRWYSNSHAKIEIKNTFFILPKDYEEKPDGIKLERSTLISSKLISVLNKPGWEYVPYLKDSLKTLPVSEFSNFCETGRGNKFQIDLSQISIDTVDPNVEGSNFGLLEPTTFRVYGRFFNKTNIELNQPQLEMALHASSCTIVVKEEHEKYLSNLTSAYKAYFNKLRLSNEQKEELKHKIDKGAKIAISATSQVIEKAKVDKISAVEEVLKTFQCAVTFRAEKGTLSLPIHSQQSFENANGSDNNIVISESILTTLNFVGLNLTLENSAFGQSLLIAVKNIRAEGVDHPRSPSSISLLPLVESHEGDNLRLVCQRRKPNNQPSFSEIGVSLHGMQIVSQAKKGAMKSLHRGLEAAIPDLKRLANKISGVFVNLKNDKKIEESFETVKEKVSQGVEMAEKTLDYLNLTWEFAISDCKVHILDSNWSDDRIQRGEKPFGTINISSFNKKIYSEKLEALESQLIKAKMTLAQSESVLDNSSNEKKELLDQIAVLKTQLNRETAKLKDEMGTIEQQLITTKMNLAFLQQENDELRQSVRKK